MKVGVMFSGGLDSTVMIAKCLADGHEVYPIMFKETNVPDGMRENVSAMAVIRWYGLMANTIMWELDYPFNMERAFRRGSFPYMPGYKMIMQTMALAACEANGLERLYTGYTNQNTSFTDESAASIHMMTDTYNQVYKQKIEIVNPLIEATKLEAVQIGHELEVPFHLTLSCVENHLPPMVHCGKCKLCKERKEAFILANVKDPSIYWDAQ